MWWNQPIAWGKSGTIVGKLVEIFSNRFGHRLKYKNSLGFYGHKWVFGGNLNFHQAWNMLHDCGSFNWIFEFYHHDISKSRKLLKFTECFYAITKTKFYLWNLRSESWAGVSTGDFIVRQKLDFQEDFQIWLWPRGGAWLQVSFADQSCITWCPLRCS